MERQVPHASSHTWGLQKADLMKLRAERWLSQREMGEAGRGCEATVTQRDDFCCGLTVGMAGTVTLCV